MRYNGRRRTAYLFVDNRAFESEVLSVPRIFCAPMRRGAVSGSALQPCGVLGFLGLANGLDGDMLSFFRSENAQIDGTGQVETGSLRPLPQYETRDLGFC